MTGASQPDEGAQLSSEMAIQAHLRRLEEKLLEPGVRSSRLALARLLHDDFREAGSSGQVYDKQQVIESLLNTRPPRRFSVTDLRVQILSPSVALVTYRAERVSREPAPSEHSLRSSIWKLEHGSWQMIFHQGTATEPWPAD